MDGRKEMSVSKNASLKGRWIVRSHVSWTEERNIIYKGLETLS